jgi:glycosyltransferase involved in cell wall biosynthesis
MRVALVHYSAPPVIGGVEKILAAHAQLFREHGHEVKVISRSGEADLLLESTDAYEALKSALASVELVIAHNLLTMPFDMPLTQALWRLSQEEPQKRWIAWVHDVAAMNPHYQYDWHRAPWDQLTQASPAFEYIAISPERARQFETLTRRAARVVPNGVSPREVLGLTPDAVAFAAKHLLDERDLVLLHPTRLLQRKNVEFGMKVLAELRGHARNAVLLITAAADPHNAISTEYGKALRARRIDLGLEDSAVFVSDDFTPDKDDLSSLYSLADALLFPSTQEGFGLPVLEAALHRLPIFCADVEPMNSLLQHSIHAFDPYGSPCDVAKLIERILDQSAPHRARREVLRRYTWERVWEEHLAPLLEASR